MRPRRVEAEFGVFPGGHGSKAKLGRRLCGRSGDWGQRPWGDPFTLRSTNLELCSADPLRAPNSFVRLTDFGWWYAEDELLAISEDAVKVPACAFMTCAMPSAPG